MYLQTRSVMPVKSHTQKEWAHVLFWNGMLNLLIVQVHGENCHFITPESNVGKWLYQQMK